jgi:hypothetical protein
LYLHPESQEVLERTLFPAKMKGKSMIQTSFCLLCGTLSLYLAISVGTNVFAADGVAPVRLDRDKMAGLALTAIPPDAYKDILVAGELNMRVATLFEGKELRASIFELAFDACTRRGRIQERNASSERNRGCAQQQ